MEAAPKPATTTATKMKNGLVNALTISATPARATTVTVTSTGGEKTIFAQASSGARTSGTTITSVTTSFAPRIVRARL